jgi:hypothetical protein
VSAVAFLHVPAGDAEELARRVARVAPRIGDEGSLWLLCPPAERGGAFLPWAWLLHDAVAAATGLALRNVLLRVDPALRGAKPFAPVHDTLLWFVRDAARHAFDKAPLRVPHAYEHVEWGGRARGRTGYHGARLSARYPPGGRDPGNVLLVERRDAGAQLLGIEALPVAEAARRVVLATSRPAWPVLTNLPAVRDALRGARPVEEVEL